MSGRSVRLAAVLALLAPATVAAQAGAHPWTVRARAVAIVPDAKSDPAGLSIRSAYTLEVDISRSITRYLSAELILATAAHEVTADGASIGSVTHLPPTLLLQLRPLPSGGVSPYLGAGVNLTLFFDQTAGLRDLDLSASVGWAAQTGVDIGVGPRALINVDLKYVHIGTDISVAGTDVAELDINPFILGIGLGYRF